MISRNESRVPKVFDRIPPHDIEAEMALLGSLILDGKRVDEVASILDSDADFYKPNHQAIYRAVQELVAEGGELDVLRVKSRLDANQTLVSIGGVEALLELCEAVPTATSAIHYAKIVRDRAIQRRLIDVLSALWFDCYETSDAASLLDRAQAELFRLSMQSKRGGDAKPIGELLRAVLDDAILRKDQGPVGIQTGFMDLDDELCGLQEGQLIIVAARPSMGKTALAMGMAENMAYAGTPVAFFSLEMSDQQLASRVMSSRSGVPAQSIRIARYLTDEQFDEMARQVTDAEKVPLLIADTPGITVDRLASLSRRLVSMAGVRCIFIDYLQIMGREPKLQAVEAVSRLSAGVKQLARELAVPIVLLSQLSRACEMRDDKRPRLSDLRESGSIEQDADVVLMLYREDYYHRDEDAYRPTNLAEVNIAKQRNGPVGVWQLHFDGTRSRFTNALRSEVFSQHATEGAG